MTRRCASTCASAYMRRCSTSPCTRSTTCARPRASRSGSGCRARSRRMPLSPSLVAEAFPAIGLAQLDADAALRDRMDVKYVVPLDAFAALADRLMATHAALEIDGRRAFAYRSTYFDTPELGAFRAHIQQRRRRYKCRSREYRDSGAYAFEVKLKGLRGRTVKHRMEYDRHELSDAALIFLRDCLDRAYGRGPGGGLRPALAVAYTPVTL